MDYEDELDLLSTVAVTQIGADGRAHLDFHCNEHGILLKSIPLKESWDVVRENSCLLFSLSLPHTHLHTTFVHISSGYLSSVAKG